MSRYPMERVVSIVCSAQRLSGGYSAVPGYALHQLETGRAGEASLNTVSSQAEADLVTYIHIAYNTWRSVKRLLKF